MKCPHCNKEHSDDTKICPNTGKKIELLACQNRECPDFGKKRWPADSRYCPSCGKKIISCNSDIAAYLMEGDTYTFINIDGTIKHELASCRAVKNEYFLGNDSFHYFHNGMRLFRISPSDYVDYGEFYDFFPLNENLVCVTSNENDRFAKLFDNHGQEVELNFRTSAIFCVVENKYYLAATGRERVGLINISDGSLFTRVSLPETDDYDLMIDPVTSLIISFEEYNNNHRLFEKNINYFDINTRTWIDTGVCDGIKKFYMLDSDHILLKKGYKEWELFDISQKLSVATFESTPIGFGNVVTGCSSVYLPSNTVYDYIFEMQIGDYAVIEDWPKRGLINLKTGEVVVPVDYDLCMPVFNNRDNIRFICFT